MRYFLVFLLFLSKIISQNIDEQFFSANNYYNSSNYLESIELYEISPPTSGWWIIPLNWDEKTISELKLE